MRIFDALRQVLHGVGLFTGFLGIFVVMVFFVIAPTAWVLMLLLGVLHSVVPEIPAIGFWVSFTIVGLLSLLF